MIGVIRGKSSIGAWGSSPLSRNSMEIRGKEEGEEEKTRERRRRIDGWKEKGDKPKHESWICH